MPDVDEFYLKNYMIEFICEIQLKKIEIQRLMQETI